MNYNLKLILSTLDPKLKHASTSIQWDQISQLGHTSAKYAAKKELEIDMGKKLTKDMPTVEASFNEGMNVSANLYSFTVAELEDVLEAAFNAGADSVSKPRGPDNSTWTMAGF